MKSKPESSPSAMSCDSYICEDEENNEGLNSLSGINVEGFEADEQKRKILQVKKQIDELLQSPEASTKLKWKDISNLVMMNPSGSTPGSIGISIDGLYQLFSKEGKTRRKLEAMKQEDLKKLLVEYRYNTEYISYITKLKGQELKNFMKYCNLPDNFVLTANDYDLTFEVFRCLEDFKR